MYRPPKRKKATPRQPKFLKTIAGFSGPCDVCPESFAVGDTIYRCAKTAFNSRVSHVHVHCYLSATGAYAPSR